MASSHTDDVTDSGVEYKTDIRFGPTYRWVCNECGRRVGRWETTTGDTAYTCDTCDETYLLRGLGAYKIEKIRVD